MKLGVNHFLLNFLDTWWLVLVHLASQVVNLKSGIFYKNTPRLMLAYEPRKMFDAAVTIHLHLDI